MKKLYLFLGLSLFSFGHCSLFDSDSLFGDNNKKANPSVRQLKRNDTCLAEIATLGPEHESCKQQCRDHGDLAYEGCKDVVIAAGNVQEIKPDAGSPQSTATEGPSVTPSSDSKE